MSPLNEPRSEFSISTSSVAYLLLDFFSAAARFHLQTGSGKTLAYLLQIFSSSFSYFAPYVALVLMVLSKHNDFPLVPLFSDHLEIQVVATRKGKAVVVSIDPCRQYLTSEDEVGFKAIKLENLGPNEEEYALYQCTDAL
ncbi:unnamed protein product [Lactuca virosa]|uniref:Uncharacterized protein n=1 Tax=Lactuca virosa TaxID=75947 RepID=A0AAU9PB55_9ASTR|nr:unnamed protein product [Lactuca virosa]